MITKKGDFKEGVISFLLFSSMSNSAEMYLSKEIKKTRSGNFKKGIAGLLSKTSNGFLKNTAGNSIDTQIEAAIEDSKNPGLENNLFSKDEHTDFLSKIMEYNVKEPVDEIKTALKNLYSTFVSYAKKTYASIATKSKKVDGFVKLTIYKIIKIGEYIMALTTQQWNRVPGSFEDKDSFAPTMSQKASVDDENAKYSEGHQFWAYRA